MDFRVWREPRPFWWGVCDDPQLNELIESDALDKCAELHYSAQKKNFCKNFYHGHVRAVWMREIKPL